ncbi:MAG: NRDE family protein [Burkholderiales bacterium]
MCLVALAIDQHPRFPLVIASNRDEFFARPTARLGRWKPSPDAPDVLSGRDLQSGGTWLGLTAQGRMALLTNVRGARPHEADAPSRGSIVTDWLAARESTADFWTRIALSGHNGFNLIAADFRRGECFFASNVDGQPRRLGPGLYGLSNAGLDAPWPKVVALKAQVREALAASASADALAAQLFAALGDRSIASDDALPRTGIPLTWERQLSAAFIRTPDERYGTRCSTVVITERSERQPITHVLERSFNWSGAVALLRSSSMRNWPPRDSEGDLVEVIDGADQSARVISMCAMPASSNTGPAGTKPARA